MKCSHIHYLTLILGLVAGSQAGIITQYDLRDLGDSQLVTLNAREHGDPYNLGGDRTPYRMYLDVSPGHYDFTFVDSVPGFIAWSPGGGYYAAGVYLRYWEGGGIETAFSVPMTGGPAGSQEAAFANLLTRHYEFDISQTLTLEASLTDHMLGDNSGGVSFVLQKTAVPEPASFAAAGALAPLGFAAFRRLRKDHPSVANWACSEKG